MKRRVIFFLILVYTVIAVSAGMVTSWLVWDGTGEYALFVGDIDISGLTREKAEELTGEYYGGIMNEGKLTISVDSESFDVNYGEIGLDIAWKDSLETVYDSAVLRQTFFGYLKDFFYGRKIRVLPDYSLDKGLLMDRVREISETTVKEPEEARIVVENDSVLKFSGVNGYILDVGKAVERIMNDITIHEKNHIHFEPESSEAFLEIKAGTTLDTFDGLDAVISKYVISLNSCDNTGDINRLIEKFEGLVINISDADEEIFSYKREVPELVGIVRTETHNIMASAIYGAFLCSGIEVKKIGRVPCDLPREYAMPGLEARVEDNDDLVLYDMPFERIMLWVSVNGTSLETKVIGPEEGRETSYALHTEIEQVLDTPVIYVQDSSLKEQEREVAEPGIPGMKVHVYRYITENEQTEKEMLYTEIYRPVSRVVKVGATEEKPPSQK